MGSKELESLYGFLGWVDAELTEHNEHIVDFEVEVAVGNILFAIRKTQKTIEKIENLEKSNGGSC